MMGRSSELSDLVPEQIVGVAGLRNVLGHRVDGHAHLQRQVEDCDRGAALTLAFLSDM